MVKLKHIETEGCIVNIRTGLCDRNGKNITHIEILPDNGWALDGSINNRVIRQEVSE